MGLALYIEHALKSMNIKVGLSKELLELVVLGFKLSKLGSVGRLHAAKAGAPLIEGWLAKATGPAKFLDGHARVSLFEEADDLLIGKSGLFHSRYSPKLAVFVPSLWYGRQGQVTNLIMKFLHTNKMSNSFKFFESRIDTCHEMYLDFLPRKFATD